MDKSPCRLFAALIVRASAPFDGQNWQFGRHGHRPRMQQDGLAPTRFAACCEDTPIDVVDDLVLRHTGLASWSWRTGPGLLDASAASRGRACAVLVQAQSAAIREDWRPPQG